MKQRARNRDFSHSKDVPTFEENDETYSVEKGERFLEQYARGLTLAQICSDPEMPRIRGLWEWRKLAPEFAERWDDIKAVNEAAKRQDQFDYQMAIAEEILTAYGTCALPLRQVLDESEDYPSMMQFHGWCKGNPTIGEMRTAAEESKAVLLAEEAMQRADVLGMEDPRAVTLQVRCRHWLAERFWRAKFGQQPVATERDDLVGRSQAEAETVLKGLVGELESIGIKLNDNVH